MKKTLFGTLVILGSLLLNEHNVWAQDTADPGTEVNINDNWKFHPGGIAFANRIGQKGYPEGIDENWESVSLPHTWNAVDPFDDDVSYVRGIGWYRKYINIDGSYRDRQVYIKFEGANQRTELYVNGAYVGQHKGGYTGFTFDITNFIEEGKENLLAVMVDNSHDNTIAPLSVGYALYGGIYRDVRLLTREKVHFSQTHYGSTGIYVSTPAVSRGKALVSVRSVIENFSAEECDVNVRHIIMDKRGDEVLELSGKATLGAGGRTNMDVLEGTVRKPHLWSPETPELYRVISLIEKDGKVLDKTESPLGFRWFSIDPDKGFILNGEKYLIKGTNRHQDFEGLGSALPDSQHIKDLEWIRKMGANFVRLAHYPQDPTVLQAADKLGLMVWEEVPNVNYIVPSPEMTGNSASQLREMIYQGFNHPSVIFWGSSNEIFLWDKTGERKSSIGDTVYRARTRDFVYTMDSIIRVTDPHRLSALAIHGSKDYDLSGIAEIPQMLAVNHYSGWYSGSLPGFGSYLDSRHRRFPNQVIFVSEYGAGSDTRINTTAPERFDFSGKYQQIYHKSYLKQINERPYLAGSAIWNQFDFSQPHTGGSIYHINQKGIQNWDRTPKDAYFLYKANWNPAPMVYIASRDWTNRSGWNGMAKHTLLLNSQEVSVYSNMDAVELFLNGRSLGEKQPDPLMEAVWQVPFEEGKNSIKAVGRNGREIIEDLLEIIFTKYSLDLNIGGELAINAGFNCEFDAGPGVKFLPDQVYSEGHYGYVDGQEKMVNKDVIIRGAEKKEPLFNYYIEGLSEYKLDIPNGTYDVQLFFAEGELFSIGERVFDVHINGEGMMKDFDMFASSGFAMAIEKSFPVKVSDEEGLTITFNASKGEPLLNGIRIKKIN